MMGKRFLVTLISVSLLATSASAQKNPKVPQVTTPDTFRGSDIASAADQTSAAKAAYFPRISLTGFLGFQSNQLSNLFTGPSGAWSFVPQITQPIFTAGRLKSNVKFAKAQQEFALVQYQQMIQTAFREVS